MGVAETKNVMSETGRGYQIPYYDGESKYPLLDAVESAVSQLDSACRALRDDEKTLELASYLGYEATALAVAFGRSPHRYQPHESGCNWCGKTVADSIHVSEDDVDASPDAALDTLNPATSLTQLLK